jgi:hypothetical protein
MRRNEERKPGEESLRPSHAAIVVARSHSRTIWAKLSPISTTDGYQQKPVGGLMVLAHPHAQKLRTRQPAFFLIFSLSGLGRERDALDPPTGCRLARSESCISANFVS